MALRGRRHRPLDDVEHASIPGYGLAGMRERVWAHGGELRISPTSGHLAGAAAGTALLARFGVDATAGVQVALLEAANGVPRGGISSVLPSPVLWRIALW